jgi:uncharacterized membrane protein
MSRGEFWKGVAISAIMAVVFGLIGGAAIWYALQMVGIFGESMGVDARSREIYAESHKIVHLFAAACGLAIGWFLHRRNWVLFAIALLAIGTCGSYGVLNMYGFASASRVTVAATKDAARAAEERAYQNRRADLSAQIDWLQKTAVSEDGRERRKLLADVDAKRKELSDLKPPVPTAETVLSDTQSSSLAELTGTSARRWLVALPLPLAVFVFFAESFSLIIVGHMLAAIVAMLAVYYTAPAQTVPSSQDDTAAKDRKVPGPDESGGGSKDKQPETVAPRGETVIDFPGKIAAPPQQLQADAACNSDPPKVSAEPPRVPAPAPRPKRPTVPLSLEPKQYASIEAVLAANPSVSSQTDIADAMGVSKAKVSRDIKRLEGRGKVKVARKNGRTNAVTLAPRRNGASHAYPH